MPFTIDPDLLENNEFQLTENGNGNLALESKSSGNIFTIDENSSLSDKIESTLDENLNANGNDITNIGSADAGSVTTEYLEVNGTYRYAGSDEDLDDALEASVDGDCIILGNATFADNRTIRNRLRIVGTGSAISGSEIAGDWILNDRVALSGVFIFGNITVDGTDCKVFDSSVQDITITVSEDRFLYVGNNGTAAATQITFESGTVEGLVDSSIRVTVADNGSNIVGDIA